MPSLYEATSVTKNILKWGGIGLGAIIFLVFLYRGGKLVANTLFPNKPAAPKAAYGKLPAIIFPDSVSKEKFTYSLETINGGLGAFPDRAGVYKTVPAVPNLLNLQTTRAEVAAAGFNSSENSITDTEYSWRDAQQIDRLLTINIVSSDFTITSNYLTYPNLTPETIINPTSAMTVVYDFDKKLNIYPSDFDLNKTATQLLALQRTTLYAASSQSTAEMVRVDLFQNDVDKLPIMYAHPPYSSMHFLIGGEKTNQILDAVFAHQTIGTEFSAYPIIPVNTAYSMLKQGKAYIASYYGNANDITIKNVYLGYYMSDKKQDFLMPIYVFEGKDGFFAYVPAITTNWITN